MNVLYVVDYFISPLRRSLRMNKIFFTLFLCLLPCVEYYVMHVAAVKAGSVFPLSFFTDVLFVYFLFIIYALSGFLSIALVSFFRFSSNRHMWCESMPLTRFQLSLARSLTFFYIEILVAILFIGFSHGLFSHMYSLVELIVSVSVSVAAGFGFSKILLVGIQKLLNGVPKIRDYFIQVFSAPLAFMLWSACIFGVYQLVDGVLFLSLDEKSFLWAFITGVTPVLYGILYGGTWFYISLLWCVAFIVIYEVLSLWFPPLHFQWVSRSVKVGFYGGGALWKAEFIQNMRLSRLISFYVALIPLIGEVVLLKKAMPEMNVDDLQALIVVVFASLPALIALSRGAAPEFLATVLNVHVSRVVHSLAFAAFLVGAISGVFTACALGIMVNGEYVAIYIIFALSGALLASFFGSIVPMESEYSQMLTQFLVLAAVLGLMEVIQKLHVDSFFLAALFVLVISCVMFVSLGKIWVYRARFVQNVAKGEK
ncbi:MAG: hypothetical protein J6M18_02625 [Actinomycetaceae bacterium]|nr:hypothetical protein [Actinomycetaceae bacterium]